VTQELAALAPQDVVICSVVKAELLFGARRSNAPAKIVAMLDVFFSGIVSFPFDDPAAMIYGEIRERPERAGTPIGPNDLMIAAIAVSQGVTLITHNTREFSRVQQLMVEDWEKIP
jgi:tRNA(fMet)-specific endonuclease VapC